MYEDFKIINIEIVLSTNGNITKKRFRTKMDEDVSDLEYYLCVKELYEKLRKELTKWTTMKINRK